MHKRCYVHGRDSAHYWLWSLSHTCVHVAVVTPATEWTSSCTVCMCSMWGHFALTKIMWNQQCETTSQASPTLAWLHCARACVYILCETSNVKPLVHNQSTVSALIPWAFDWWFSVLMTSWSTLFWLFALFVWVACKPQCMWQWPEQNYSSLLTF